MIVGLHMIRLQKIFLPKMSFIFVKKCKILSKLPEIPNFAIFCRLKIRPFQQCITVTAVDLLCEVLPEQFWGFDFYFYFRSSKSIIFVKNFATNPELRHFFAIWNWVLLWQVGYKVFCHQRCHFSFVIMCKFSRFHQKSIFSSRTPVFVISSVFHKRTKFFRAYIW